jgi:PleD family two-component response regulator
MMLDQSAFETGRKLKNVPPTVDIPAIFFSALRDVKNKVRAMKTGRVDYVPKPVNTEEVSAMVGVRCDQRCVRWSPREFSI